MIKATKIESTIKVEDEIEEEDLSTDKPTGKIERWIVSIDGDLSIHDTLQEVKNYVAEEFSPYCQLEIEIYKVYRCFDAEVSVEVDLTEIF